ncbi:MAG: hypothetical protein KGK03_11155, partial [Candidatus Omnitrophica bacterium]|nr:hypothetical protein [Candidatus Omnitrophota bacterium]
MQQQVASQIGTEAGQMIAQGFIQAMQGPSPQEVAAQQAQQQQIAAQQAAIARQQAAAEARRQQGIHDRLVSEMQSDDGTAPAGIKGLPGIYLNGSSNEQSGQQGLQLMKDDDNGGSAGSTPVASNVSSAATEQSGRQGLQLMKDDDNNANEGNPPAAQDSGTQPTAGGMQLMKDDDGGTSQSQAAVAPAPLPQQADASQTTGATSQPDNQSQQKVVNFSGVPVSQANLQTGQAQGGGRNSGSLPVIDPHAVVDPEVVSGVNPGELTAEDKALMGHQWQMSIDPRYLTDPQVIANMNNIWAAARKNDAAANDKLKTVMADQLKAHGMTHQQIDDFFNKFQDIADGQGPVPSAWNDTSEVANDLDIELGAGFVSHADDYIAPKYYSNGQILTDIEIKRSVQAPNIAYQGHGPQTEDDCVLHAIANGAQVPFGQ